MSHTSGTTKAGMAAHAFTIRDATPKDAVTLCELIRELAEYERLSDHAQPDPVKLARHLQEHQGPRCEALLAANAAGESIGFALYFPSYSTFLTGWGVYLEDLFVRPSFRGRGVGRALLSAVAQRAVTRGGNRLELSVLDWNTRAIDFYVRHGAVAMDGWTTMRFMGPTLLSLAEDQATSSRQSAPGG